MQVFISSTCYDLIDLRAELEGFFRDMGIEAFLSDSPTSEFRVMPEDRSSIETCLANVRACDEFIIILSRRYGPSLIKAGFPDISATHLEYREAVRCNKPIRMYVRDKLDGEFGIWRANQKDENLKFLWCKDAHDRKLFGLLAEHRDLIEGKPQNNWFWLYPDSVVLKRRLAIDFKPAINRIKIDRLAENGLIPFLEIDAKFLYPAENYCFHFELFIRNLGTAAALAPVLEIETDSNQTPLRGILGQQEIRIKKHWHSNSWLGDLNLNLRLSYSTIEGHQFLDHGILTVLINRNDLPHSTATYKPKKRHYLGRAPGVDII